MKKEFHHPEPSELEMTGPKYWRSLDELADTPGFREQLEREFPEGASSLEGVDRRNFLKIMAASFALAGVGLTGCRRPARKILPYAKQVEDIIPGRPLFYATTVELRKRALPILAETHAGRPTKIEGNPSYAGSRGKTDLLAQASVLDLYDPDRSQRHRSGDRHVSKEEVNDLLDRIAGEYRDNEGEGLAFLAEESSSPTRRSLVEALRQKFPKAIWAEYESIDENAPERAATRLFGRSARPRYKLGGARRILSLDADFLHNEPGHLNHSREFTDGRRLTGSDGEMNRLYVVESHYTITGGMADHRLRLSTSLIPAFAALLGAEILEQNGHGDLARSFREAASGLERNENWESHEQRKWLEECARDLAAHPGESLIMAGCHLPEEAHMLVFALNWVLENVGKTIEFLEVEEPLASDIKRLASAIDAGNVKTLFVLGGNPAHNAPADLNWPSLQRKAGEVVRYGYYDDETSHTADHHIAGTHFLESWGDARTCEGTVAAVQPMIEPLYDGINLLEVLGRLAGWEEDAYEMVEATVNRLSNNGGEPAFRRFLHDGLLEGSEYPVLSATVAMEDLRGITSALRVPVSVPSKDNLEVRFVRDNRIDDGRFANNGWLQECPDPMTKLTWDNAIIVSPRLAEELDLKPKASPLQVTRLKPNTFDRGRENSRIVKLTINGREVVGPLHVFPGLANYTVILPLGYGRSMKARVATGFGFNPGEIRTSDGFQTAVGAKIEVTNERYLIANAQEHWSMEGRAIIREATLDYFQENPEFAHNMDLEAHAPPNTGIGGGVLPTVEQTRANHSPRGFSLHEHPDLTGDNQWSMSIDLTACTGCSACVIACQSENNVPIVGKDQVMRGREMHWMRVDRYFSSGSEDNTEIPEDPQVSVQPMLCQHCENAPCEVVCPVNATVHDEEGLNVMVYNRCIGTRYCANNCPYKVRRFNFFDWNERQLDKLYLGPLAPKGMAETLKMQKNPNVTVRMRGVMEKCTFCTQRITEAKIEQKVAAGASGDVMVREANIQTACQQACPTDAIVFGNLMDPESKVAKLREDPRSYSVLGYLNVRPRVTYLARIRNPNKEMPDFVKTPFSKVEYETTNYSESYKRARAQFGGNANGTSQGGTD